MKFNCFHVHWRSRRRLSTVRLRFCRFFEYDLSLRSVACVSRTDLDFFPTEKENNGYVNLKVLKCNKV